MTGSVLRTILGHVYRFLTLKLRVLDRIFKSFEKLIKMNLFLIKENSPEGLPEVSNCLINR